MEQTAQQKEMQKTLKISAKQANEIKVSKQIAERLKNQWEDLAKRQRASGIRMRADRKITSVTFVKDQNGKIAVQVNMYNGRSIKDNGHEKALDRFKEQSRRSYVRARVAELLRKIREYGYAAVEGEIPPELKEAVLKGMEKANISTSYKGRIAEAAEAKQAAQNAAKAADAMAKALAPEANNNAPGIMSKPIAPDIMDKAMGVALSSGSIRKGTLDGDCLTFPSKNGEPPFSISATEPIKSVIKAGTTISISGKNLHKGQTQANIDTAATCVDFLNKKFGNHSNNIIYRGDNKITYQNEDKTLKTTAFEIAARAIVQENLIHALENLKDGKASEEEMKLINLHANLFNKDFNPNNLETIDKAIKRVKTKVGANLITNVEKLNEAGLEELALQVSEAKKTERKGRENCDNALRDKLLSVNNKESQKKIALIKDLLGKEERHESLTDPEQKLLDHVHKQYDKVLGSERLTAETDLRQNEDALFDVLKSRRLFGAIKREQEEEKKGKVASKQKTVRPKKTEKKADPQPLNVSADKNVADLTDQSRNNRKNGVESKEDKVLMQYLNAVTKIYGTDQVTSEMLETAKRLKDNNVDRKQLYGIVKDKNLTPEQKIERTAALGKETQNQQQQPVKESNQAASEQKAKQPTEVEAQRVAEKLQKNMKETPVKQQAKQNEGTPAKQKEATKPVKQNEGTPAKQNENTPAKQEETAPKKSLQSQLNDAGKKPEQTDPKDKSASLSDREKAAQAKIIALKRKNDLAR